MKLYDGNGKNVGEIYSDNRCCGCIFLLFIILVVGGVLLSVLKVILPFLLMILLIAGVIARLFFLTKTPKSKTVPITKSDFNDDEIEVIDDVTEPTENFNESKPSLKNEFIVIEYCETKKEPKENSETTGHFGKGTIINVESEINNWAKFYNYSNEPRYINLNHLVKR